VIRQSVPSLPVTIPQKSNSGASRASPPIFMTRPSDKTISNAVMYFVVTPYLKQCGPPAFSATFPPRVATRPLDGSGG